MINKNRILVGVVVYNEEATLSLVLKNIKELLASTDYSIVFVNDGSSDNSYLLLKKFVTTNKRTFIITNKKNYGVGKSIKNIIEYGIKNYFDICVIMAGNGKDNPLEISKLINPILSKGYDYVQGSRFLKGGSFDNLPLKRKLLIKGFTFLFYLFTGFKGTDATNGFRAYKFNLFKDKRINIRQVWLDRYEFETYLQYKAITLGYKVLEVPVSKNYIKHIKNYSKIKPIIDWWKIMRPLLFLKVRIKN